MEFKDKLIYVRAALDISQTELAEALNVSFQTINRWENGKVTPTKKAEIKFEYFCRQHGINLKEVIMNERN